MEENFYLSIMDIFTLYYILLENVMNYMFSYSIIPLNPKKLLTPQTRELALKAEFKNCSNIKIHSIDSEKCFNNTNDNENIRWDSESKEVIKIVGCEPNIVFSSEPEYEEFFKKSYPNAEIVVIDAKRELFDISATEIRKNGEMKCWEHLSKAYKVLAAKSIVLFGEAALKRKIVTDLTKLYQTTCECR